MGKTTQPLKILTIGMCADDEWRTLQAQGHTVHVLAGDLQPDDLSTYDLIMGPKCWRLLPHLLKYLPLAIKEARAVKPKKVQK